MPHDRAAVDMYSISTMTTVDFKRLFPSSVFFPYHHALHDEWLWADMEIPEIAPLPTDEPHLEHVQVQERSKRCKRASIVWEVVG